MKLILGMIAFILTFGFSTTLVGLIFGFPKEISKPTAYNFRTNEAVKHRIRSLLRRDVRYGYVRRKMLGRIKDVRSMSKPELFTSDSFISATSSYVSKSSGINDAGLPRDFQYAWRTHMKAWKKHVRFLGTTRFNPHDEVSIIRGYTETSKEIEQTWFQVLRIAERYGLHIDRRYYR